VAAEAARPDRVEQVFRSYSRYVAALALRILGRVEEVEDVVQDVFMIAFDNGLATVPDVAMRSWLTTVTVRTARHQLRARRLHRLLRIDDAPAYGEVVDPRASPMVKLLTARVYAALDEIGVAERLAWTLRYVEGERLEDVAVLCRCSLATAKRRISSAHQKVLKRLHHA
jgi:RNA polymerase sigma-70 factor (ECF subfamily)